MWLVNYNKYKSKGGGSGYDPITQLLPNTQNRQSMFRLLILASVFIFLSADCTDTNSKKKKGVDGKGSKGCRLLMPYFFQLFKKVIKKSAAISSYFCSGQQVVSEEKLLSIYGF